MDTPITVGTLLNHAVSNHFNVQEYLRPGDPDDTILRRWDSLWSYRYKFSLGALIRPSRILELGVGSGYAAAAILEACPGAEYVGVDRDTGDANSYARNMLSRRFPHSRLHFVTADFRDRASWLLEHINRAPFDLIHIDGGDTFAERYAAIRTGLWCCRRRGFMAIGGYNSNPYVREAVDDFLLGEFHPNLYVHTLSGDVLINCGFK